MTCGTNNFAELIPYVQALWFHDQRRVGAARADHAVRVCIVSDSEVTVCCGNGQYARRANGCLWSAVGWFEQCGYRISWHHVRRNTNLFNAFADDVAGILRQFIDEPCKSVRTWVAHTSPVR